MEIFKEIGGDRSGGKNPIGGSVRGLILLNTENIEKKIEIDEAITEHR